jgi:hypothetical protein
MGGGSFLGGETEKVMNRLCFERTWNARGIGICRALTRFDENRFEKFFIQRIPPIRWQPGCCFGNDTNGARDGNLVGTGHLVDSRL